MPTVFLDLLLGSKWQNSWGATAESTKQTSTNTVNKNKEGGWWCGGFSGERVTSRRNRPVGVLGDARVLETTLSLETAGGTGVLAPSSPSAWSDRPHDTFLASAGLLVV